jgi:hypothetical protein
MVDRSKRACAVCKKSAVGTDVGSVNTIDVCFECLISNKFDDWIKNNSAEEIQKYWFHRTGGGHDV